MIVIPQSRSTDSASPSEGDEKTLSKTKLLWLALIAIMVVGVACSSEEDPTAVPTSTTSPITSAATATTVPTSTEPIRIGYSAWPGWFPWKVTEEQGFFEDVGVNVEMVWFEGYLDSINAFAAGQLDGNSQTLSDTLASIAIGDEQVIVLTNDNSTGNDKIIVSEGIESIEDLAGKRIGVEVGVVDHFLLLLGLESVGMTESDVEIVPLETGAAASSFQAGQLDAVGVFAPFTTVALEREGSMELFSSADFPGAIPDHLALSTEIVSERPEDVQKIIEAWYMTLAWIDENRTEAVAIMAEQAGVSPEDYETYDAGTTLFSVEDNISALTEGTDFSSLFYAAEQIAQFLVDSEFVEELPELDGVFDTTFVEAYAASQ